MNPWEPGPRLSGPEKVVAVLLGLVLLGVVLWILGSVLFAWAHTIIAIFSRSETIAAFIFGVFVGWVLNVIGSGGLRKT